MSCTPEEIEQKRKQALAKLHAKKIHFNTSPQCSPKSNYSNSNHIPPPKVPLNNEHSAFKAISSKANIHHNAKPYDRAPAIKTESFFGRNKTINAVCSMINETRFDVNLMGYNVEAIDIFKTIPSRQYAADTKMWNFSIEDYDSLLQKLSKVQDVIINKIPSFVLSECKKLTPNLSNIDLSSIEPELLNSLMPFQKEAVCFAIHKKGRCLLGDDMGLGKTFQSLAVASYYRRDWPLLIVTTSTTKNSWESVIHKYLPSVSLHSIQYMTTGKDYINDADILICSHDMLSRSVDKLAAKQFGVFIIDESHIIKNFKTKVTQSAIKISKIATRVLLLSGTPVLSRPNEIFSQLSIIDDKFFGGFFEFSKRYCDGKTSHYGWDASGSSNLAELNIVLAKRFMIRRTKGQVLSELPAKSREVIKLDVGLNQLSEKDQLCLSQLVDNYKRKKAHEKHSALLSLFSESARLKIPSVCLYIEHTVLKDNNKFLVFAHHQLMLDAICKILNNNKKTFIRIDGHTTLDQRKYFIDKFQLDDSCIAAVLSITAANAGITLTAAQLVLFAELHWNPSILSQAESRAHRIGQSGKVRVKYLLGTGTVDDHIWPLLQSKQDLLSEVGLSKDSFKDTSVSEQVIESNSLVTRSGTKLINDYFPKKNTELDSTLQEFLEEDDDFFVNADIDF